MKDFQHMSLTQRKSVRFYNSTATLRGCAQSDTRRHELSSGQSDRKSKVNQQGKKHAGQLVCPASSGYLGAHAPRIFLSAAVRSPPSSRARDCALKSPAISRPRALSLSLALSRALELSHSRKTAPPCPAGRVPFSQWAAAAAAAGSSALGSRNARTPRAFFICSLKSAPGNAIKLCRRNA